MTADLAIIGGGAAGLMAAIWASRTQPDRQIVVVDSAKQLGKKILISGGGRCNVTHQSITPQDFWGSSQNAIRKVLNRFDQPKTVQFFESLGVSLKTESTGKLFPTTDKARTVLDALIHEAERAKIRWQLLSQVENIEILSESSSGKFRIVGRWGNLDSHAIILATGGKSIPQTGSDGHGLEICRRLGHIVTEQLTPALVPLTLNGSDPLTELAGISLPAQLSLVTDSGKRIFDVTGDILFTHHGLSGPAILDISRHWIAASAKDTVQLHCNFCPGVSLQDWESQILSLGSQKIRALLKQHLPERLVDRILEFANLEAQTNGANLTRESRKKLLAAVTSYPVLVSGTRGFKFAEVTAGGVPLSQIDLKTMQSRIVPDLYFCGEICDVDARIGGFNFQWAWSSGYVAGISV